MRATEGRPTSSSACSSCTACGSSCGVGSRGRTSQPAETWRRHRRPCQQHQRPSQQPQPNIRCSPACWQRQHTQKHRWVCSAKHSPIALTQQQQLAHIRVVLWIRAAAAGGHGPLSEQPLVRRLRRGGERVKASQPTAAPPGTPCWPGKAVPTRTTAPHLQRRHVGSGSVGRISQPLDEPRHKALAAVPPLQLLPQLVHAASGGGAAWSAAFKRGFD